MGPIAQILPLRGVNGGTGFQPVTAIFGGTGILPVILRQARRLSHQKPDCFVPPHAGLAMTRSEAVTNPV